MTPSFALYKIAKKEVHVPSEDYYARGNASDTEEIQVLEYILEEPTHEAVVETLKSWKDMSTASGVYTILPVYSI